MSFDFYEWRQKENIQPYSLKNRDQLILDLMNIEHSWSGRLDPTVNVNVFIMEAEQLLVNAISLFEQGYFDCAYYCLRESIEVSTIMVYLIDMSEEEKDALFNKWKANKHFPMQANMLNQLYERGNVLADMKAKLPDFFENARGLLTALNKYVHKQGFQNFYIIRNHPIHSNEPQDSFINTFEENLKKCISVVAVMRLSIDPFPILLMDKEILYRYFDSMTDPYSEEFVSRYISDDIISDYKKTDIYCTTYASIIQGEKKSEAVFDVMKHQYIDSMERESLLDQLHLLSETDAISTLIVLACKKITKVYTYGGMLMFFTDRKTNRSAHSWNGSDFNAFEKENALNQRYDEAYISTIMIKDECYFMEHNELIDENDYSGIKENVEAYL